MSEIVFPQKGDHFGVCHASGRDGSYRNDILVCVASDSHRIVAKFITSHWNKDAIVFYRDEWQIQTVSDELVQALLADKVPVSAKQEPVAA